MRDDRICIIHIWPARWLRCDSARANKTMLNYGELDSQYISIRSLDSQRNTVFVHHCSSNAPTRAIEDVVRCEQNESSVHINS